MKTRKRKIIIIVLLLILGYLFLTKIPKEVGFLGLDGRDYVGLKEAKPSGISDIHLRKILKTPKEIKKMSVRLIGGQTWVYPLEVEQMPLFLSRNGKYIDVFLEPDSPYTRGIYILSITYSDGSVEQDSIIP